MLFRTASWVLLLSFLSACGAQRAKPRARPKPAPPPLSAEQRQELDRLYYQAVEHYTQGRYEDCRSLLAVILKTDPNHRPARTLRDKAITAGRLQKDPR